MRRVCDRADETFRSDIFYAIAKSSAFDIFIHACKPFGIYIYDSEREIFLWKNAIVWPVVSAPFQQNHNFNQNLWFYQNKTELEECLTWTHSGDSYIGTELQDGVFLRYTLVASRHSVNTSSNYNQYSSFIFSFPLFVCFCCWIFESFDRREFITHFLHSIFCRFLTLMQNHFFFLLSFRHFRTARFYWVTNGK